MAKLKALIDDPMLMGRWKAGEIGEGVECDSSKYSHRIDFGVGEAELFGRPIQFRRVYYFYADEVEVVPEGSTNDH